MAKKTVVETYDDLTGEKIDTALVPDPTITFSIDGVDYEIELGAKNRDKFYAMFNPYIQAARKVRGNRTRRTPPHTVEHLEPLELLRVDEGRDHQDPRLGSVDRPHGFNARPAAQGAGRGIPAIRVLTEIRSSWPGRRYFGPSPN